MPRHNPPTTPLLAILRALESDDKRDEFAKLAGTTRAYLYQIATCRTKSCRTALAKGIADASLVMHRKYGTQVLDLATVATMCALPGAK